MPQNDAQHLNKTAISSFAVVRTFAMPWARGSTYMATDQFNAGTGTYSGLYRKTTLVDDFSALMDAAAAEQRDEESVLDGMVGLAAGYRRWITATTAFYSEDLPVYFLSPDLADSLWEQRFDQRILQTCTPRDCAYFLEFGRQERLAYSDSEGKKYVDGALIWFFRKCDDEARTLRIAFSASNVWGEGTRQPGPVFDIHGRDVGTLGFHAALKESAMNQYLEDVPDVPSQVTIDERTFRALLAEKTAIAHKLVLRAAPLLMGSLRYLPDSFSQPVAILPENTPDDLRRSFELSKWSEGAMYARARLLENGFPAVFPLVARHGWTPVSNNEPGGSGSFHQCPFCGALNRGGSDDYP